MTRRVTSLNMLNSNFNLTGKDRTIIQWNTQT